ncbi:MAG: potassium channel family protein [Micrococcales bacterium]|nr:potassium channel family protein [Micrococcales bacterium]
MAQPQRGHKRGAPPRPLMDLLRAERQRRTDEEPAPRLLDRFGIVLLLVLATIVAQSLIDVRGSAWASLVTHAISGAALIVAVRAAGVKRRWRHAADALIVVTLVAHVVVALVQGGVSPTNPAQDAAGLWLIATILVPFVVARRVLQHSAVTVDTVMGAVASYLQIAVGYAAVFASVDALGSTPFYGEPVSTTVYMYASLETITTLGYGDRVPATDFGGLLAGSEAVLGQVFLVTFVALIVSRFAAKQSDDRANGSS